MLGRVPAGRCHLVKAEGVRGAGQRRVQWERSACRRRVISVEVPELEIGSSERGKSLGGIVGGYAAVWSTA